MSCAVAAPVHTVLVRISRTARLHLSTRTVYRRQRAKEQYRKAVPAVPLSLQRRTPNISIFPSMTNPAGFAYYYIIKLTSAREKGKSTIQSGSSDIHIPLGRINTLDPDSEPLLPPTSLVHPVHTVYSDNNNTDRAYRREAESSSMAASRYTTTNNYTHDGVDMLENEKDRDLMPAPTRDTAGGNDRERAEEKAALGSMFANAAAATGMSLVQEVQACAVARGSGAAFGMKSSMKQECRLTIQRKSTT